MKSIKTIISNKFLAKIVPVGLGVLILVPFMPVIAFAVSDTTPPSVSITLPLNGATVSSAVSVGANASDISVTSGACVVTILGVSYDVTTLVNTHSGGSSVFNGKCGTDMTTAYQGQHSSSVSRMSPYIIPTAGIAKIEFYVDGVLKSSDTSSPYNFTWDSTTVTNGSHTLLAKAFDLSNNHTNSATVNVIVNNTGTTTPPVTPPATTTPPGIDNTAPTVSLSVATSTKGPFWSKKLKVSAVASDNIGVTKVRFYLDGKLIKKDVHSPYSFFMKTKKLSLGQHTLVAKAYDSANNEGISSAVTFTVNSNKETQVKKDGDEKKSKDLRRDPRDDRDHDEDENDD